LSDTYLGGEKDKLEETMPKRYENFFRRRDMVFVLLLIMLAALIRWMFV